MRAFTNGSGFELRHIVDNFPWGNFHNGTVVDVILDLKEDEIFFQIADEFDLGRRLSGIRLLRHWKKIPHAVIRSPGPRTGNRGRKERGTSR